MVRKEDTRSSVTADSEMVASPRKQHGTKGITSCIKVCTAETLTIWYFNELANVIIAEKSIKHTSAELNELSWTEGSKVWNCLKNAVQGQEPGSSLLWVELQPSWYMLKANQISTTVVKLYTLCYHGSLGIILRASFSLCCIFPLWWWKLLL